MTVDETLYIVDTCQPFQSRQVWRTAMYVLAEEVRRLRDGENKPNTKEP